MDTVIFEFSGAMKRNFPETRLAITLNSPKTIEAILLELGYTTDDLTYLVYFVNQQRSDARVLLHPGDRIKVLPPIGGG